MGSMYHLRMELKPINAALDIAHGSYLTVISLTKDFKAQRQSDYLISMTHPDAVV